MNALNTIPGDCDDGLLAEKDYQGFKAAEREECQGRMGLWTLNKHINLMDFTWSMVSASKNH